MFNFHSQNNRIRKESRSTISRIRQIINKNADSIDSQTRESLIQQINELENRLDSEDNAVLKEIKSSLEEIENKNLSRFVKSKLRQNIESLVVAVVLALIIREFIVQPFKIPSGSMIPTLLVGDHLLVTKFMYGTRIPFTNIKILPGIRDIKYGDVIVFKYPNGDNEPSKEGLYYIKRVVGLPGDKIDVKGRNLYINDNEIPLAYLRSYDSKSLNYDMYVDEYNEDLPGYEHLVIYQNGKGYTDRGEYLPYDKIPDGHYFVMGDNRDNSRDSRFWGLVPEENVAGKALLTHWSWDFDNDKLIDKVRWNRIFKMIK